MEGQDVCLTSFHWLKPAFKQSHCLVIPVCTSSHKRYCILTCIPIWTLKVTRFCQTVFHCLLCWNMARELMMSADDKTCWFWLRAKAAFESGLNDRHGHVFGSVAGSGGTWDRRAWGKTNGKVLKTAVGAVVWCCAVPETVTLQVAEVLPLRETEDETREAQTEPVDGGWDWTWFRQEAWRRTRLWVYWCGERKHEVSWTILPQFKVQNENSDHRNMYHYI